jgi:hypothetical protein
MAGTQDNNQDFPPLSSLPSWFNGVVNGFFSGNEIIAERSSPSLSPLPSPSPSHASFSVPSQPPNELAPMLNVLAQPEPAENKITDAAAPSHATPLAMWQSVDEHNLARGGGNMSNVKQSTREIDVLVRDVETTVAKTDLKDICFIVVLNTSHTHPAVMISLRTTSFFFLENIRDLVPDLNVLARLHFAAERETKRIELIDAKRIELISKRKSRRDRLMNKIRFGSYYK